MLGDKGADFIFRCVRARCERHDRARFLAERAMRDRDQRCVDHGGMLVEDVLDLDAVNILAAADQHVLGAIDDVAETFFI